MSKISGVKLKRFQAANNEIFLDEIIEHLKLEIFKIKAQERKYYTSKQKHYRHFKIKCLYLHEKSAYEAQLQIPFQC